MDKTALLEGKKILVRDKRLAAAPESAKRVLVASWSGKCSPRKAIKAFCLECIGFDRAAVRDCQSFACPLWEFRPFQTVKVSVKDDDGGVE